ncbi:carboxymuconolactone decarboxylase family protein [Chitinophaga barathri]|uniref:Carboxymuconolactone decarboxylase family protein n=1 Tax=Chitinophaga barathri TaxID=1647451 RepID=A0A3N4MGE7_9BACT|nr:carboxymuconolactone decarboxylase family protein [Chitinophaga barathri]RPD39170.1 carboxymuconolactone decarboxylase family protein [Chitinophaga barathri]
MSERIKIPKAAPAAYKAMQAFESYLETTRISPLHHELIRIRASQINGCAYCVDKHSRDARSRGETEQRIYALTVWRETPFFTEEEQAILAIVEEVTLIHQRLSDETYAKAAALFDEEYLAQIIMAAIIINAWNRIGVSTHMQPARV